MSMQRLAKRVEQIAPFQVMAVMGRAKQLQADGEDVIHLEVGEPDLSAPEAVNEAGTAAIIVGISG